MKHRGSPPTQANRERPLFDIHVDPPRAVDLSIVRLFHRNEASFVTFMRKEGDDLRTFKQLRVDRLAKHGPRAADLDRDSYFSLNGFRRWGSRRAEDLSALNAAYVDLDYYKADSSLTWQTVAGIIEAAVRDDVIPAPSLIMNSGQGAWLVWLLVAEDDPTTAPTGRKGNQAFLRMINDRLVALVSSKLPSLGVDPQSDLSRCLRVPGSMNSKSTTRVRFFIHRTPWRGPLMYTLDKLASEIALEPPSFRRAQRSLHLNKLPPDRRRRKRRGSANLPTLMKARLAEIERIAEARDGFREGHRNSAALIVAVTLRALHEPPETIADYLSRFARRCQPPLSAAQVRGATADRRYRFKNANIAARLGVTAEEAETLGLTHIRPDYQRKRPPASNPGVRTKATSNRRDALREIVAEVDALDQHALPSLREFVDRLSQRNIRATPRTVGRDLDQLGIGRRHRRGTTKVNARQLVLTTV